MNCKEIKKNIIVEISESELSDMCKSIKNTLDWINSRSLSANGTTIISIQDELEKTYTELKETLNYMREC